MDNEKINELAEEFAQTGDQVLFVDLFTEIYPFIRKRARSARSKADRLGVRIPAEDFESRFAEGLYDATKGFRPELGDFMPRLQSFMRRKEADTWRGYSRKGDETDKDGRRYDKARAESLDRTDDTGLAPRESGSPCVRSAEDQFFEQAEVGYLMKRYAGTHERYGRMIQLLGEGATSAEIARFCGEAQYNAKVRKRVQRAKDSFRTFWLEEKRMSSVSRDRTPQARLPE